MTQRAYMRPAKLDEALAILADRPVRVLAGGTDVYPEQVARQVWGGREDRPVLDISALGELRGIREAGDFWRIGALATWTDIARKTLPPMFDALKLAALELGGIQIQNRGTLAGNLVNASPAADGVPPLMALDALVEVQSSARTRRIAIGDFIVGNRQTVLEPRELVTGIVIPKIAADTRSHFLKLGARRYLVISIVMVAGVIVTGADGTITDARIAIGACSPKPVRLGALELALRGSALDDNLKIVPNPGHFSQLEPIDDLRASAEYRAAAAFNLTCELLEQIGRGVYRRVA